MKVLFIIPPNYIGRREISRGWTIPDAGIASVAAFLREGKVQVQVIDLQVEHLTPRQLEGRIATLRPDIVGITALTQQIVYAGRVAEMIKRINPEIYTVICWSRVDLVDGNLLKKMRDANCKHVDFGVESGNQQILKVIKKGITLEQARDAITWTKEVGIKASANFIFGHPFETLKTATQTIRFALELDTDYAVFSILVPFPGTEVAKMAEEGIGGLRIETRDWMRYDKHAGSALSLKQLDRTALERLRRTGYLKFYLRPGKFLNVFQILNIKALPTLALQMGYLKVSKFQVGKIK